jgi:hypothetical protein
MREEEKKTFIPMAATFPRSASPGSSSQSTSVSHIVLVETDDQKKDFRGKVITRLERIRANCRHLNQSLL